MHRLFGKTAPAAPKPTMADASSNIGTRITDIDAKIKSYDEELLRYKKALKQQPNNQNIKKRATECLRKKNMYVQQRDQFANQQFNMDQTQFAIETVQNTQESVAAMKVAAKQLKKETKKINLSELEDLQDDMEDMLEDVGDINELLGRSYGCPDGVDEEDLDAELAMLEDDMFEDTEQVAMGGSEINVPQVPALPQPGAARPDTVFTAAEKTAIKK
jgi:charged multivesicular body protein 5